VGGGGEEAEILANIFQQAADNCKATVPLLEEFTHSVAKLQFDLAASLNSFSSFLETFEKIADKAHGSKASSSDIGECLKNVHEEHRRIEKHFKSLVNTFNGGLSAPVQRRTAEFKVRVAEQDKAHWKDYKRTKSSIKRKKTEVHKIEKKQRGQKDTAGLMVLSTVKDKLIRELEIEQNMFVDQEREWVRKLSLTERCFYCQLSSRLTALLARELSIFGGSLNINQEMLKLEVLSSESEQLPAEAEAWVRGCLVVGEEGLVHITPPPSPSSSSLLRSWGGSSLSIISLQSAVTSPPGRKVSSPALPRITRPPRFIAAARPPASDL